VWRVWVWRRSSRLLYAVCYADMQICRYADISAVQTLHHIMSHSSHQFTNYLFIKKNLILCCMYVCMSYVLLSYSAIKEMNRTANVQKGAIPHSVHGLSTRVYVCASSLPKPKTARNRYVLYGGFDGDLLTTKSFFEPWPSRKIPEYPFAEMPSIPARARAVFFFSSPNVGYRREP
jgi:hypothetical protein